MFNEVTSDIYLYRKKYLDILANIRLVTINKKKNY